MKLSVVLKLIDRRALIAAAVLVFVAVGLQVYVSGNSNSKTAEVEAQVRQLAEANEQMQSDIARMRLSGVESVGDLLRKVGTAEANLPSEVDPLTLQTLIAQGAAVAGVELGTVAPAGGNGALTRGTLKASPFTYQIRGQAQNVFDFFDTMTGADGWIVTFGDISLSPPSGAVTEGSTFASGDMTAAGTMYVWTTASPRLVGSAALEAAGQEPLGQDAGEEQGEGQDPEQSQAATSGDPLTDLAQASTAPQPAAATPTAPQPPASPAPVASTQQ